MSRLPALLLLLAVTGMPVTAGTVYKCSGAGGQVTYQDAPCTKTQQQQTLQLSNDTAAPSPSAVAAASAPATVDQASAAPAEPGAPLPQLYRCMHAVDGSVYVSGNGHPQPFLAPLGMLGALPTSLAQTYGSSGGAGISAPEANRGRVTPELVANNYVWVQDQCRPLSEPDICHELRDEYEQNARQLQRAFKSDQPLLQHRDSELHEQLTNC
ncbi:MAG TPA: DUF4124 domain-containing protein [Rhodanobacter sp.]|nr:DUF4124 domain-containing protein [Rhodanobacter sp.]